MAKLFIIGNGFDISHGLKTKYEHFHEYLINEYPEAAATSYPPEYVTDGDGNEAPVREDDEVGFIRQIISDVDGEEWNDLEYSVGTIHFSNYMMDYENDENDDDDFFHEAAFNESWATSLVPAILDMRSYFSDWISAIRIRAMPKDDFLQLIDANNDLFINFNYTRTLEELYNVRNICHIHGIAGGDLIFGHGRDYSYFSDENYGTMPGTEDSFQKIHDALKKDTEMALTINSSFFKRLDSSITDIYSYGFSFSEVDAIYIENICARIDTMTVVWHLHDYDDVAKREGFKDTIIKCGFKGSFSTYSIRK
jgi:hypothetical protein